MNKGSGNNNTRSEVFEYKENPLRNTDASVSLGVNRKSCALIGDKQRGQTKLNISGMSSPNKDPTKITKMAEIRMPIRPSNSFPEEQPPSPSSSDIDSFAEDERERE